jgi:hypothetical protein
MTRYLLVSHRGILPIREYLESNADFLHFLGNGVLPKCIAILTVKVNCLTDCPWNLYAEFVGPLKVAMASLLHERYNSIAFLKEMWNLPIKGWLIVNAAKLGKLGGFNRVRTLQVREILP